MSYKVFFKNNITSVNRFFRKKRTLKTIKGTDQKNLSVVSIYRIEPTNVGDFYCAPHLYFDKLGHKKIDILDYKHSDKEITGNWIRKVTENALVIGGGGLLNRKSFEKQLRLFEYLNEKGKKTVIWGAGHNSAKKKDFGKKIEYNIDVKKFGLAGLRDYQNDKNWLPCVSCMHPVFDKEYREIQELGIVFHKDSTKNKGLLKRLKHYPATTNSADLEELISFIGRSNTIVTDSYHAMYWAMLLGKKVLAVPNSTKFFNFKYQPVFTTFESFEKDLNKTNVISGLLEETREINIKFANRVFDYLEL